MEIFDRIDGHKTHLAIAIALVLVLGNEFGWIGPETFDLLLKLDGLFAGYAVRDALKKLEV